MNRYVQLIEKKGVGYIIINRPKANGYNIDLMTQLVECIHKANEDNNINIVVIKSAIEKFFCAGADIKSFGSNDTATNKELVDLARTATKEIECSQKIYIAALNGHTLGGGLELALACDLRMASDKEFYIGLPEVKLGLIPGNGGTQRLVRLIGRSAAMELLLTGDSISPRVALALRLIHKVWPAEEFETTLEKYAENLANGPILAYGAIKRAVLNGTDFSFEEGLQLEKKLVDPLYDTVDAKEGFQAFLEKRIPNFRGQ